MKIIGLFTSICRYSKTFPRTNIDRISRAVRSASYVSTIALALISIFFVNSSLALSQPNEATVVGVTITALPVVSTAGAGMVNITIANISDPFDFPNTSSVTVNGGASAAQNGVTISNLHSDAYGVVTADVASNVGASTASFTITVRNRGLLFSTSTLPVIVAASCAGTGAWIEDAKVTAPDGSEYDEFGWSVAATEDTIVVGAFLDDSPALDQGSAYVFVRNGASWSLQQKLTASDGAPNDVFGYSVAISGDTVIVGSRNAANPQVSAGAAYVFTRTGGIWSQQQKLAASDSSSDGFGYSVAISGDLAIIGATYGGNSSGSADIFKRNAGIWTHQQKLLASDGAAYDEFGRSVCISGDAVIIGSPFKDAPANDQGAAYIFRHAGDIWSQQQKLSAPDGSAGDHFGGAVAISGSSAVVGAWSDSDLGIESGSAYMYQESGGSWNQEQKVNASDQVAYDQFGRYLSMSGDVVVFGSGSHAGQFPISGGAYIFERTGGIWSQRQKLTASHPTRNDLYGWAVAVSGNTVAVGAQWDDAPAEDQGSVYIYERDCISPSPTSTPTNTPTATPVIIGNVDYAVVSKPVPVVSVDAAGSVHLTTTTNSDGDYSITGFGSGPYILTPTRTAEPCAGASNGIFANDASLISRYVVGSISLTSDQLVAAKVTGDLTQDVSALDAAFIAQKIVGICGNQNLSGQWVFSPSTVDHPDGVTGVLTENYRAYMMGDVNGDWDPVGPSAPGEIVATDDSVVTASLPANNAQRGSEVIIPLRLVNLGDRTIDSLQFDILYDPAVITIGQRGASVEGAIDESLSIVSNSPAPGLLKVAAYGALPVGGDGVYVYLKFKVKGDGGSFSKIKIAEFRFNDGSDPVTAKDGLLTIMPVNDIR